MITTIVLFISSVWPLRWWGGSNNTLLRLFLIFIITIVYEYYHII
jgi:hypothetical protein